ncbi:MAG: HAD hydrolase-like protein [Candidatus Pelethousia sp.]|nr:HAD hydrolase-like protein [Candidatus Pelethousia sp.]
MQLRYSTILFDFDGTLLESGPAILTTMRIVFSEMGLTDLAAWSEEKLWPLVGPPLWEGFSAYLKLPPEQAQQAVDLYRSHAADEAALALLRPYPGIPEMLKRLREHGAKIALATAKHYRSSRLHLRLAGLTDLVDYVSAPRTDRACNKTQLIFEAMEALSADPAHTIMVGDRLYDMDAANCAGIPGVGVLYGYGSREELETHGATHIVQSVKQLYSLLVEQEEL